MNRVLPAVIALVSTLPALIPAIFFLASGGDNGTRIGWVLLSMSLFVGAFTHLAVVQRLHRAETVPVSVSNK